MKARVSPSCDRPCLKMAASRIYLSKKKLGDSMIKQLSVIHDRFYIRHLLMDSCIGHFEVARETGTSCTMGMFRGRYGFFLELTRLRGKLAQNFSLQ